MNANLVVVYQCSSCLKVYLEEMPAKACCGNQEAWETEAFECEETGYLYLAHENNNQRKNSDE